MTDEREIPDSHVVDIANQFCDAAKMLYEAIPNIGPQVVRINAAFAIELYIKSLDCHWVPHSQRETLGVVCNAITTEPNKRGHKLDVLFDHLDRIFRQFLIDKFALHTLNRKYDELRDVLSKYSDSFIADRYKFESLDGNYRDSISESVELALFFQSTVNSMERVRTCATGSASAGVTQ